MQVSEGLVCMGTRVHSGPDPCVSPNVQIAYYCVPWARRCRAHVTEGWPRALPSHSSWGAGPGVRLLWGVLPLDPALLLACRQLLGPSGVGCAGLCAAVRGAGVWGQELGPTTAEGYGDIVHEGWDAHLPPAWQDDTAALGLGPCAESWRGGSHPGGGTLSCRPGHCLVLCQGEDGFPGFKGDMGIKGDRVSVWGSWWVWGLGWHVWGHRTASPNGGTAPWGLPATGRDNWEPRGPARCMSPPPTGPQLPA